MTRVQALEETIKTLSQEELAELRDWLSSITDSKAETANERYRRLRAEIVGSGLPLLGDEELRKEIESRKGDPKL
ncbi:MAG TPA: hypothetical protein VG323_21395 [Thermoanaerobaculia bacterium]|nr:hypothetical protein [Thermoanaerobaculia bacterium]